MIHCRSQHDTSRTLAPLLTAIALIVWGSTYIVSTQLLPGFPPLMAAMQRTLPAGLLPQAIVRQLPPAAWLGRASFLMFSCIAQPGAGNRGAVGRDSARRGAAPAADHRRADRVGQHLAGRIGQVIARPPA